LTFHCEEHIVVPSCGKQNDMAPNFKLAKYLQKCWEL